MIVAIGTDSPACGGLEGEKVIEILVLWRRPRARELQSDSALAVVGAEAMVQLDEGWDEAVFVAIECLPGCFHACVRVSVHGAPAMNVD
jgi:hypothetical protein